MQEKAEIINVIGDLLKSKPIATPTLIRNILGMVREHYADFECENEAFIRAELSKIIKGLELWETNTKQ